MWTTELNTVHYQWFERFARNREFRGGVQTPDNLLWPLNWLHHLAFRA
jgi:hypothetical protein